MLPDANDVPSVVQETPVSSTITLYVGCHLFRPPCGIALRLCSVVRTAVPNVACQLHGTTVRGFLPRAWDHLVASDGTTGRVGLEVLITSGTRCLQVDRLGGSGDGVPGGCGD